MPASKRFAPRRPLTGQQLGEVAFPLGGIGTGTISLGGRGQLRDWEIFNSPGKGNEIAPALFALWCKPAGAKGKRVARVLERELLPPFMDRATYGGGHGVHRVGLPGLPRFREAKFTGQYPLARLELTDPSVPLTVSLEAFNPMIPLDEADSGIPVAVFNWTFANPTGKPIDLALAAVTRNPVGFKRDSNNTRPKYGRGNLNELARDETMGLTGLKMSATRIEPADPQFGTFALATPHAALDVQTRWTRTTAWWDEYHLFWDDFAADGRLNPVTDASVAPDDVSDVGGLALRARLKPGETITLTVLLAWHFPNRLRRAHFWGLPADDPTLLRNWYATRWTDAWDVARYAAANLPRLSDQTRRYHRTLFASTLPPVVLDAVSSQSSIVRTTTGLRLADGSFHAFEGCNDTDGCCPMNCTHVWNYAQAAAFLFPALERSVRETDFLHNTRKAAPAAKPGLMAFRTILPTAMSQCACGGKSCDESKSLASLPSPAKSYDPATNLWDFLPAADGQLGTIMRACREWRLSGDRAWLARIWPDVIRALEFAWLGEDGAGKNAWDPTRSGVITGQQHNTYDIEFFGPNPLTTIMYLGALRAGEELAVAMTDPTRAAEYRRIYALGRRWIEANLWSREYFIQKVTPPTDRPIPDNLRSPDGSPKYQVGTGCLSDQLLGQFLAHVIGLGHLIDPKKAAAAMAAVFRHNFRDRLGDYANVQRAYGLGDEAGLLLCSWPRGNREQLPFPYCDEVWTGVEYQVAAGLIFEGLVDEGLAIVAAVRDRYAGHNRNPFNEVECGHHYARAMASWGVLIALTGFRCDAAAGEIGFAPRIGSANAKGNEPFRTFYSTGSSWGLFEQKSSALAGLSASLKVEFGTQALRVLRLVAPAAKKPHRSPKGKRPTSRFAKPSLTIEASLHAEASPATAIPARVEVDGAELAITFDPPIELKAGQTLTVRMTD